MEQHTSLIAEFSLPAREADRFLLLFGIDPRTGLHVSDSCDLYSALPYLLLCDLKYFPRNKFPGLWLDYFPEIGNFLRERDPQKVVDHLWQTVLSDVEVRRLGYGYRRLSEFNDESLSMAIRDFMKVSNASQLEHLSGQGRSILCQQFPYAGVPGRLLEESAGLTSRIKKSLSLSTVNPGLLIRYTGNRGMRIF